MNPLRQFHEQAEAEFQQYGEIEIVCTFGEPQAEYAAIHKGCALIDLPQRGILEATGADRIDFLNRFLTNELIGKESKKALAVGTGAYAFLLNNKGRIVADVNVIERGDRTLLETDARNLTALRDVLEKHVFSEEVKFESLLEKKHQISLHGPTAADILRQIVPGWTDLPLLGSAAARIGADDVVIWRDDPCGVPGYYIITSAESAGKVWMQIVASFSSGEPGKRAVRPAGWAVFNTVRIEAGRPMFGIDFDATVLPAETGQLQRAVSFTKGCYLGQEIVARMYARGQVARQIVGFRMQEDALPIAGAPIVDEQQNQIGGVTSSTISPVLSNASIGLAMVKAAFSKPGATLRIAAEGAIRPAAVVELPFVANQLNIAK
jgi:folate-binding protein YgfZ